MPKFKTTIGLEIHIQLATKSKMFCGCDNNAEDKKPNTNVCPICLGMPGTLPLPNKQAIKWTIKTGLALGCKINKESKFDRKHYFYPDLPKGFQISQYDKPFAIGGNLLGVRINRIHLEEDAGKLIHRDKSSFVDLNRAGTPLMEIVTEPDISSPSQAQDFLKELQLIIRYLGVSEASMEKGHLRCDANIDIKDEKGRMSPIVELKNINSFRFIKRALEVEEKRLAVEYNNWPEQRIKLTRGYNSKKDITEPQREKEEASDYRYFPEPDIPPIIVEKGNLFDTEKIKLEIGQLPQQIRDDLAHYSLDKDTIEKMVSNPQYTKYLFKAKKINKQLILWIVEEVSAQIKNHNISYNEYENKVPTENLSQLVDLIEAGKISHNLAKGIFDKMVQSGERATKIIEKENLAQLSDQNELSHIVEDIIKSSPDEIKRYKAGEKKLLGYFMGQIMAKTSGRANPQIIKDILEKYLKE